MPDCNETHEHKIPLIGDVAPSFAANTTNGIVKFPESFRGHWIVFFSHPMDFTPVCTSEFMAFQSEIHVCIRPYGSLQTGLYGLHRPFRRARRR